VHFDNATPQVIQIDHIRGQTVDISWPLDLAEGEEIDAEIWHPFGSLVPAFPTGILGSNK